MSTVPEVIRCIERGTYDTTPGLLAIEDAIRRRRRTLGVPLDGSSPLPTVPRAPGGVEDILAFCGDVDDLLDALAQIDSRDVRARIGTEVHGKLRKAKLLLEESTDPAVRVELEPVLLNSIRRILVELFDIEPGHLDPLPEGDR